MFRGLSILSLACAMLVGCAETPAPAPVPPVTPPVASVPEAKPADGVQTMPIAEFFAKKQDEDWRVKNFFTKFALEGVVKKMNVSSDPNRWYVTLAATKDGEQELETQIADAEIWRKIVPGQTVVVQDVFAGLHEKATLVRSGPNPLPRLAAADLAAEYAADKAATVAKYKDQWLLVTGKYNGKHPQDAWKSLETGSAAPICFDEPNFTADRAFEPGEELTLVGRFVEVKADYVMLSDALPFERKSAK